jgi:hypothetical protein
MTTDTNLTGLDALVLAQVHDPSPSAPENAFLTIFSPNMQTIPEPLVGIRRVRGREDGRFGLDDFTQHPQVFSPNLPHLPFVLRKLKDSTNFLWRELKEGDVNLKSLPGYAGSLQLQRGTADFLIQKGEVLLGKCREVSKKIPAHRRPALLMSLPVQMMFLAHAVRDSVYDFRQLKYMVAGFQRFYLESLAMHDYCVYWMAKMATTALLNEGSSVKLRDNLMGTFTDDPVMMMKFKQHGVPVWGVRRTKEVPLSLSIMQVVEITQATVNTADANPPFRVLYEGYAGGASSIACSEVLLGGLAYGLSTKSGLRSLNPNTISGSRIHEFEKASAGQDPFLGTYVLYIDT